MGNPLTSPVGVPTFYQADHLEAPLSFLLNHACPCDGIVRFPTK
ncbi:MAG TPA: hypothetical protein VL495_02110 [Edaphobacter sp.]|jgi:hypothetical protein|nr:hypothetical protein [Edaphobacter sp.]